MVKLVRECSTGRLLSVHILGEDAAELVHQGQTIIRHRRSIEELVQATINVATRSDAYKYAAYDALTHMEIRAVLCDEAG